MTRRSMPCLLNDKLSLWTSLADVDSTSDVVTCSWVVHLALGDVPYVPAVWDTPCFKRLACVNLFSLC